MLFFISGCCAIKQFISFIKQPAGINGKNLDRQIIFKNDIGQYLVFLSQRRRKHHLPGNKSDTNLIASGNELSSIFLINSGLSIIIN